MTNFIVGEKFDSFLEFENKLLAYQKENFVIFIKQYSSKLTNHGDEDRIRYHFVKYGCKQGSKRKSESLGIRPNQSTVKQDCPAFLRVAKENVEGRLMLCIKAMSMTHENHALDEAICVKRTKYRKMAAKGMKVAMFLGSTRAGRLGSRVSKFIQRHLENNEFEVDLIDPLQLHQMPLLEQPIHFYDDQSKIPQWLSDLDARVRAADAYVIVSAEYNGSIPPALTNVMNHFPPASYAFKPSSIVTYSVSRAGGAMVTTQLRNFLSVLGSLSIPFAFSIPEVDSALDENGYDLTGYLDERAQRGVVTQLSWMVQAFKQQKTKAKTPDIFF